MGGFRGAGLDAAVPGAAGGAGSRYLPPGKGLDPGMQQRLALLHHGNVVIAGDLAELGGRRGDPAGATRTGSATTDSRTGVPGSAWRPSSYRIEAFERVGNVPPAANDRDSFLSDRDVADDDVALPGVARVAGTCQPDRPMALRHQP